MDGAKPQTADGRPVRLGSTPYGRTALWHTYLPLCQPLAFKSAKARQGFDARGAAFLHWHARQGLAVVALSVATWVVSVIASSFFGFVLFAGWWIRLLNWFGQAALWFLAYRAHASAMRGACWPIPVVSKVVEMWCGAVPVAPGPPTGWTVMELEPSAASMPPLEAPALSSAAANDSGSGATESPRFEVASALAGAELRSARDQPDQAAPQFAPAASERSPAAPGLIIGGRTVEPPPHVEPAEPQSRAPARDAPRESRSGFGTGFLAAFLGALIGLVAAAVVISHAQLGNGSAVAVVVAALVALCAILLVSAWRPVDARRYILGAVVGLVLIPIVAAAAAVVGLLVIFGHSGRTLGGF